MTATITPRPHRHASPGAGGLAHRGVIVLVLCALAGLLTAGLLLPAVGTLGVISRAGATSFNDLPEDLKQPPLPQRSIVLAADGSRLADLYGAEDRVVVPLAQVAPIMQKAIVDIEDSRFYEHHGVDYRGLLRAAVRNQQAGTVTQGGSTLTQQYVKNVLIEDAKTPQEREEASARSTSRKLQEARYALALERKLSKKQILERYLNIAYYGSGAYGIGTAAQHYFGVPSSRLSLPQAALLAGIVKNPTSYDPFLHPKAAKIRRDTVIDRMAQLGTITPVQAVVAKRTPIKLTKPARQGDACQDSTAPFFCDYVRGELLADQSFAGTPADRAKRLFEGGLTIKTTLDPRVQADAQSAIDQAIDQGNRVATAVVVMKPGTGEIVAMASNRRYGTGPGRTKVPLPTTPHFQPGSTFKAFTLAAALEAGFGFDTTIYAPPCYVSKVYIIGSRDLAQRTGDCSNGFSNAEDGEGGTYNLVKATWDSVNTYFIQLEERVGVFKVRDMAERVGIPKSRLTNVSGNDGSLTLGSREVSPLDMAAAYSTFAAHGVYCPPKSVTTIDTRGVKSQLRADPCRQVLESSVADNVTSVLEGVINHGTAQKNGQIGRPAAGKTGTTTNFRNAWFVGYTPEYTTAVWVGDDSKTPQPLRGVSVNAGYYDKVYGGDLPTLIWSGTMRPAEAGMPVSSFPYANEDGWSTPGGGQPSPQPTSDSNTYTPRRRYYTNPTPQASTAPTPAPSQAPTPAPPKKTKPSPPPKR